MPRHKRTHAWPRSRREIPASIRRRGIVRVVDNVPDGHEVCIPGNLILAHFRDEIGEFMRRKHPAANDGGDR